MTNMDVKGLAETALGRPEANSEKPPPTRTLTFSSHILRELIMALDTSVILAVALGTYLAVVGDSPYERGYYGAAVGFVWLVSITLMNQAGLYRLDPVMRPLFHLDNIAIAFATTFLFLLAAAFSLKISEIFSRTWIVAFGAGAAICTVAARSLFAAVLGKLVDRGVFRRNVVIVGSHEQASRLLGFLAKTKPRFLTVVNSFVSPPNAPDFVVPNWEQLSDILRKQRVDDVVLALPWANDEQIVEFVSRFRELPVNVYLASDLVGFRLNLHQSPDHFGDIPIMEVSGRPFAGWAGVQKRLLDYALALLFLPLLLPLMILIALAVKLESRGPVFFRQHRYGFANEPFHIWKFRTMRHEAVVPRRTLQATSNDARVTRVGRFLRRSSLDELPQVFNVLNGTMSWVGPRPHAIDHNEEYSRLIGGYFARHRVKPGITGWAQVHGLRGPTTTVDVMAARVKHDIYYTENWSLFLDIRILLMTLVVAISGRNAY